jgi:hypothetical protein
MHQVHRGTTAAILLICLCLSGAGCTTIRTLPLPRAPQAKLEGIKPGSKVIVTLRSGERRKFRVTAVDTDALSGRDARIVFADIEKLQQVAFSPPKTAAVVGGTLAVLAGGFAIFVHEVAKNDD